MKFDNVIFKNFMTNLKKKFFMLLADLQIDKPEIRSHDSKSSAQLCNANHKKKVKNPVACNGLSTSNHIKKY